MPLEIADVLWSQVQLLSRNLANDCVSKTECLRFSSNPTIATTVVTVFHARTPSGDITPDILPYPYAVSVMHTEALIMYHPSLALNAVPLILNRYQQLLRNFVSGMVELTTFPSSSPVYTFCAIGKIEVMVAPMLYPA